MKIQIVKKQIMRYILFVFVLLILTSCSKNDKRITVKNNSVSSSVASDEKKNYLNSDGYGKSFKWSMIKNRTVQFGNTSGNHANRGLICEYDGWIFYNDYNNSGFLCKARTDGSEKKILVKDSCYNINVMNNYIYYQNQENAYIKRCDLDGKNEVTLIEQSVGDIIVTAEGIYFTTEYIEKVDLDGGNRTKLTSKGDYLYLDVYGDYIFYTSMTEDINLYAVKNDGSKQYLVKKNAKGSVIIQDNLFYTGEHDNLLVWYKIDTDETEIVDNGYNVNIHDNKMYYIKNNYIRCIVDNENKSYIFPKYKENRKSNYKINWYYIVGDKVYVIYSLLTDDKHIKRFIAIDIDSGKINMVK